MALYGGFIALGNSTTQTVTAATPTIDYNLIPMDLRPVRTVETVVKDTVYKDTLTVEVPKVVTKYRTKTVNVPVRDTVNVVFHIKYEDNVLKRSTSETVTTDSLPSL